MSDPNKTPGEDEAASGDWRELAFDLLDDYEVALSEDTEDLVLDGLWHEAMAEVLSEAPTIAEYFALRQVADSAPPPPPRLLGYR